MEYVILAFGMVMIYNIATDHHRVNETKMEALRELTKKCPKCGYVFSEELKDE